MHFDLICVNISLEVGIMRINNLNNFLTENHLVRTDQKIKKVSDVKAGDLVLDCNGNYIKVLDIIKHKKKKGTK